MSLPGSNPKDLNFARTRTNRQLCQTSLCYLFLFLFFKKEKERTYHMRVRTLQSIIQYCLLRFPIPSSWMHIKQSHDTASNLQNDEHLAAISATATLATSFEAARLHFKGTNLLPFGGCHSMPPSNLLSYAKLDDLTL